MNKGQWALTLEIVRHVEPFLGLSLDELKLLEGFHNASIRRQSFSGSLSTGDLKAFTPESYDNAVRRLSNYLQSAEGLADLVRGRIRLFIFSNRRI